MTGVLYAIARFCVRRRSVVLAAWLVAAIALVAVSHQMSDNTSDNLKLPGTGSQHATDALSKSLDEVRRIEASGATVICGHDAAQWASLRKGADAYD